MVMLTCWSAKGGSGTTVVAACVALTAAHAHDRPTLLVDAAGDVPAVLGIDEPAGAGLADWPMPEGSVGSPEIRIDDRLSVLPRGSGPRAADPATLERLSTLLAAEDRLVVVDAGTVDGAGDDAPHRGLVTRADRSLLVIRPCYLALRRASRIGLDVDGVVLLAEPGRSLDARDVSSVVGAPVIAQLRVEPQIARLVDAGLLCARLPRGVDRALADVVVQVSDDAA